MIHNDPAMRRHSSGFTLIELVIVIVILGILSTFALSRFADLSSNARQAKMEAAYGAMQSAASIVSMACKTDEACDSSEEPAGGPGNSITVEGKNITLAYGYPRRTGPGIARAAGFEKEGEGVDYDLAQSDTTADGERLRVRPDGDTNTGECEVLYKEPQSAGQSPKIELITDNC